MKTTFLHATSRSEQAILVWGLVALVTLLAIPGSVAGAGPADGAAPATVASLATAASPTTGVQAQTMRQYQFDMVANQVALVMIGLAPAATEN